MREIPETPVSVADTQQGTIDGVQGDTATQGDDGCSGSPNHHKSKRNEREVDPGIAVTETVPRDSQTCGLPSKRSRVDNTAGTTSVDAHPTVDERQDSPVELEAASSAAAPVEGGFGSLASKATTGFGFGDSHIFGSGGFGSVVGRFGGSSFGDKIVKDGQANDRGSPTAASNTGQATFGSTFVGSSSIAIPADTVKPVFGWKGDEQEPKAQALDKPATGEEDEMAVFSSKACLYRFDKDAEKPAWKERGVGVVRVNVLRSGKSRVVMRQAGIFRLLLNAWLFPEITLHQMAGQPRVSFMCVNAAEATSASEVVPATERSEAGSGARGECDPEHHGGMALYALRFGSLSKLDAFTSAVDSHKAPHLVLPSSSRDAKSDNGVRRGLAGPS